MWYFEKGAGCGWSRNPAICKNLKNYDAKFGKEKQDKRTSYLNHQHLKNYDAKFGKERQDKTAYLRKFLVVVMLWLEPQKPKILS
jgi:hypothetical protein